MCEPATIAYALVAVSTVVAGVASKQQGDYANSVAKYNARVTQNEAEQVRARGVEAENIQREKTAQLLARQRAQLGAANIDLSSGSALALQEDTAMMGEVDALRIKSGAEMQALSMGSQASLTLSTGRAKEAAGNVALGGSLLSAGGTAVKGGVADKWFTPQSAAVAAPASSSFGNTTLS